MKESEVIEIFRRKFAEAERRMLDEFNRALFSGGTDSPPPTAEELRKWRREARIRRLLAPWYWLRWRIVGTWNVWAKGECGDCKNGDYDY